jgi:hypothetical protein
MSSGEPLTSPLIFRLVEDCISATGHELIVHNRNGLRHTVVANPAADHFLDFDGIRDPLRFPVFRNAFASTSQKTGCS